MGGGGCDKEGAERNQELILTNPQGVSRKHKEKPTSTDKVGKMGRVKKKRGSISNKTPQAKSYAKKGLQRKGCWWVSVGLGNPKIRREPKSKTQPSPSPTQPAQQGDYIHLDTRSDPKTPQKINQGRGGYPKGDGGEKTTCRPFQFLSCGFST